MSEFDLFFKENRKERECYFSQVCSDIKDEKGNVIKWKLRPLTTEEEAEIRKECSETIEGSLKLDTDKYIEKLISASVVYPNLYDADLQDSYQCKTPEKLLKKIVNLPGEYAALTRLVQEKNGFKGFKAQVDLAKN